MNIANTSRGRCAGGILANAWSTSTGSSWHRGAAALLHASQRPELLPLPLGLDLTMETSWIVHFILLVTTQLMPNDHSILSLINKTPRSEESFWRMGETVQNLSHRNEIMPLNKSRIPKIHKSFWISTSLNSSYQFVICVAKMNKMLSWYQQEM